MGQGDPRGRYQGAVRQRRKHVPMTTIVRAVALLTALLAASAVQAQVGGYPNRPVKVIFRSRPADHRT
jgi:hypothetical protein